VLNAKEWGWFQTIYTDARLEVVQISVLPGGFSSIHRHLHKSNEFWPGQNVIELTVYDDDELRHSRRYNLTPGDEPFVIPAGQWHSFTAPQGIIACEVYRADPGKIIDPRDIERRNKGGLLSGIHNPPRG